MSDRPILIAQNEHAQTKELANILGANGFVCEAAHDGSAALLKALSAEYSAVLLDTNLALQDGLSVCARLREQGSTTPVIFVSTAGETSGKVRAFRSGADDYVTRPYDAEELILRIEAVLRRVHPERVTPAECRIGPSVVDLNNGRGMRGAMPLALTTKELQLLRYLHARHDQIVSREELLREVWRYASTDTRTVDVHVSTLRQKLEHDSPRRRHLITVPRQGYMFRSDEDAWMRCSSTCRSPVNSG